MMMVESNNPHLPPLHRVHSAPLLADIFPPPFVAARARLPRCASMSPLVDATRTPNPHFQSMTQSSPGGHALARTETDRLAATDDEEELFLPPAHLLLRTRIASEAALLEDFTIVPSSGELLTLLTPSSALSLIPPMIPSPWQSFEPHLLDSSPMAPPVDPRLHQDGDDEEQEESDSEDEGDHQDDTTARALTDAAQRHELATRLHHARQTVDFVEKCISNFASASSHPRMTLWEAIDAVPRVTGPDAANTNTSRVSNLEQARRVAEACRAAFPSRNHDWLHLTGLLIGARLGRLLLLPEFAADTPSWSVSKEGSHVESHVVGCRHAPEVRGASYFCANPDRRRRRYNTELGMYQEGCGLRSTLMSWGEWEFLFLVLVLNEATLPEEGLFLVRYFSFDSLLRSKRAYRLLMNRQDEANVAWLSRVRSIVDAALEGGEAVDGLQGQAFRDYYEGLLNKYHLSGVLDW